MSDEKLLRARLTYHRGLLALAQKAGQTAHYWKNAKAIARARTSIAHEEAEVDRYEVALNVPKPAPSPYTMYDSVDVSTVPANPPAVAGYVGGNWPTYNPLVAKFPNAKHLSIAVNSGEDADCLDVENGDATPANVPDWFFRQVKRGVARPVIYCSLSVVPDVERELHRHGVARSGYRLWTAHYTYQPHIDEGADATQYTDVALGRNLDASLCSPTFL